MREDGKISNRQATLLVISTILSTSIIFLPTVMYREAAQDSWLSVILVTGFALGVGLIITALGKRFPKQTVIQYSEQLVGSLLGKLIGMVYIAFFIFMTALILREFSTVMLIVFFDQTPMIFITISMMLTCAYAVRCGLEVLARVNEILLPIILVFLLLVFAFISPEMNLDNLTPVLERGIYPVLTGAYPATLFFAQAAILLMFIPFLNRPQQARGTVIRAVAVVGGFQLLAMVASIAYLGTRMAREQFPVMVLAQEISVAQLIERVEPVAMFIWVFGVSIKVSVFYFCAVLAASQAFKLREYKSLVLPTGVVITLLSIVLWENILELRETLLMATPYFLAVLVALPLALLLIAVLRGKGGDKK